MDLARNAVLQKIKPLFLFYIDVASYLYIHKGQDKGIYSKMCKIMNDKRENGNGDHAKETKNMTKEQTPAE